MLPVSQAPTPGSRLEEVLVGLTSHVPAVQRRLDRQFERDAREFAPVMELVAGTRFESLADAVRPSPMVVTEVGISIQFTFEKSIEKEIRIRFFNANFQSRYGSSNQLKQKIDLTVRRVPLAPV